MRQIDLIKAFIEGSTEGDALSLHIRGEQLIHYNTAILERYQDKYILNYTRYSLATGKVQKMITDTIDGEQLLFVSAVPSETRTTLADFLRTEKGDSNAAPDDYLMEIEHNTFGHGYVTGIEAELMRCVFGKQEKTLLYPQSIEGGIVKVISDLRGTND